jgi:hypothetical protein
MLKGTRCIACRSRTGNDHQQHINPDWQGVVMNLCEPHFAAGTSRLTYYLELVSRQPPGVQARLALPTHLVAKTLRNTVMMVQQVRCRCARLAQAQVVCQLIRCFCSDSQHAKCMIGCFSLPKAWDQLWQS